MALPNRTDNYLTLGSILPDLSRELNFKFKEFEPKELSTINNAIDTGVYYHLEVDKQFHNSPFFKTYSSSLSLQLRENEDISINKYSYFIAHILLELYIDHILIINNLKALDKFYNHLESIDTQTVINYLNYKSDRHDFSSVLDKFNKFVSQRFLYKYVDISEISRLLKYVLNKVNVPTLTSKQQMAITNLLETNYKDTMLEEVPTLINNIKENL